MKHVDRCWKYYPAGNKGESPEFECSAAKYWWLSVWISQLLCGRGVPCKDEGFEKGKFLKPCLANYNYIL